MYLDEDVNQRALTTQSNGEVVDFNWGEIMREGAFALIDCLGFRGIWKRADPSLLLQKLSRIEEVVHDEISKPGKGTAFSALSFGPLRLNVRLLSDTVAISLQYEEQEGKTPEKSQTNLLVGLMCQAVVQVLDLFLKGEPHLVLRGCISYGEHLSQGNFIAGPAVDEAAEHMNIAEGAFVWLLPSAEDKYIRMLARTYAMMKMAPPELIVESWKELKNRGVDGADAALNAVEEIGSEAAVEIWLSILQPFLAAPLVIVPYDMPLKTGARLRCAVVNPLVFQRDEEERRQSIETYSQIISGNRLDIWLKHQHSMDFLEVADKASDSFQKELSKLRGEKLEGKEGAIADKASRGEDEGAKS